MNLKLACDYKLGWTQYFPVEELENMGKMDNDVSDARGGV